jgi:hypothetical protein
MRGGRGGLGAVRLAARVRELFPRGDGEPFQLAARKTGIVRFQENRKAAVISIAVGGRYHGTQRLLKRSLKQ